MSKATQNLSEKVATKKSSNVAKAKVAKVTKAKVAKVVKVAEPKMSTELALVEQKVVKIKVSKLGKLIDALVNISNIERKIVIMFLIKNLASRTEKINLETLLTNFIVKFSTGELQISEVSNATGLLIEKIANNFDFDLEKFQIFLMKSLSSKTKKTNLTIFLKDMFFKLSTNQEFFDKVNSSVI